jgi:acyl-CoA thioester hydrolase
MTELPAAPLVFTTKHRINFSDLDPYQHMRTVAYAAYFVDHRMQGLRDYIGWDLKTLAALPFMVFVRRMEIDFVRPVVGDQPITITSFVNGFTGPDARIECTMGDDSGRVAARCVMIVACVDRTTNRSIDWPVDATRLFFAADGREATHPESVDR